MASALAEIISGSVFGSALYIAGVYAPPVITSQLRWTNLHMLQTFMTGSAIGALALKVADSSGYLRYPTRSPRSYGIFPYDANVIGGALIGAGMAITGACPGTVIVQSVTGVANSWFIMAGAVCGGMLYTFLPSKPTATSSVHAPTLPALLGIDNGSMLVIWEIACAAIVGSAMLIDSNRSSGALKTAVSPFQGGLMVGAAQGLTIALAKHTAGISAAFDDCGRWCQDIFGSPAPAQPSPKSRSSSMISPATMYAIGVGLGAAFWRYASPRPIPPVVLPLGSAVQPLSGFLGGVILVLGARIAGGCTSGHGISGLATFSIASFVTVAAMFAAGTATALSIVRL